MKPANTSFLVWLGQLQQASRRLPARLWSSDLFRMYAEMVITRGGMVGLSLVSSVLTSRLLGPEGRGQLAVAVIIGTLGVQFSHLGLYTYNSFAVARDRTWLSALLANSLVATFGFGGLSALVVLGLHWLWPALVPLAPSLLWLALLSIPLGLAHTLLVNLLLGLQAIRAYNVAHILASGLSVVLIVGLGLAGFATVSSVVSAMLLGQAAGVLYALRRLWQHLDGRPRPSWHIWTSGFHYGLKAYAASVLNYMLLKLDVIIVRQFLGDEYTGYYALAVSMTDVLYALPNQVGFLLLPKLATMATRQARWQYTRRMLWLVAAGMLAVSIAAALGAPIIIHVLFGAEFLPSLQAFNWLLLAVTFLSLYNLYNKHFAATGMPPVVVYSPAIGLVANVCLNWFLVPRLGIAGAGISSAAAYGLILLVSMLYVRRQQHRPEAPVPV